jgi:hypothetical protein
MVRLIGADVNGTPGARYPLAWLPLPALAATGLQTTHVIQMAAYNTEATLARNLDG